MIMQIHECKGGMLIYGPTSRWKYGMITGVQTNSLGELIVNVEWCSGETHTVHPANIYPLTEDTARGFQ